MNRDQEHRSDTRGAGGNGPRCLSGRLGAVDRQHHQRGAEAASPSGAPAFGRRQAAARGGAKASGRQNGDRRRRRKGKRRRLRASAAGLPAEVTTGCMGKGYDVTVTKTDGTKVVVDLDRSFKVFDGSERRSERPLTGSGADQGAFISSRRPPRRELRRTATGGPRRPSGAAGRGRLRASLCGCARVVSACRPGCGRRRRERQMADMGWHDQLWCARRDLTRIG